MQILIQFQTLTNKYLDNNESMNIWIQNDEKRVRGAVHVANMIGDGNCFYQSMVHQLSQMEKSTKEFDDAARILRLEVVEQIEENFEIYIKDLKLTMIENFAGFENHNLKDISEKQCRDYLRIEMIKNHTWWG